MSNVDFASQAAETQKQAAQGEGAFLSAEERAQVQRILGFPEDFPKKFGAWITQYIAVNGLEIPISQIRGFTRFSPNISQVLGGIESTTSEAFVNLTTVGPKIAGLGTGIYLVIVSAQVWSDNVVAAAVMTPAINQVAENDSVAAISFSTIPGTHAGFSLLEITQPNSEIRAMYRTSNAAHGANFQYRNIIAVRVSN